MSYKQQPQQVAAAQTSNNSNGATKPPSKKGLWFGLIFFGLTTVLIPDWRDPMSAYGASISVVLVAVLVAFVAHYWNRRISKNELQRRRMSAATVVPLFLAPLLIVVVFIDVFILPQQSGSVQNLVYAAATVLMTLGTVVALVIAYSRKGLYQTPNPHR